MLKVSVEKRLKYRDIKHVPRIFVYKEKFDANYYFIEGGRLKLCLRRRCAFLHVTVE